MTKIVDIYNYIDSFAPFDIAMDFDNVGILVGDKNAEPTRAIVTLDVTDEVIDEAKEKSAQLIVSHHPVIFNPLKRLSGAPSGFVRPFAASRCARVVLRAWR